MANAYCNCNRFVRDEPSWATIAQSGAALLTLQVLLLVMLGPRSYTAEDVVEIHTHGGGICAQRVLQRCVEAGARLARPGEFTLRAFLNGRLDLSQVSSSSSNSRALGHEVLPDWVGAWVGGEMGILACLGLYTVQLNSIGECLELPVL